MAQQDTGQPFAAQLQPCERRLRRNMDALGASHPTLMQRLHRQGLAKMQPAKNGEPTCQFASGEMTRWLHSAYDPSAEAERIAAQVPPDAKAVLVVGAGLGYVPALLVRSRPDLAIVVLEPELRFLRTMLSLFDLAEALESRRLMLICAEESDIAAAAWMPDKAFVLHHPALRDVYADRLRHARYLMQVPGARGRVLAVHNKLFINDLAGLLEDEGFAVRMVDPADIKVDTFRQLCKTLNPTFLLSINFSPELALLCTRHSVPYVSWTIDPLPTSRMWVHNGTDPSLCLAYAHRRVLVEQLRNCGLPSTSYLPLAAASGKRRVISDPQALAPLRCNASFAGSSLRVDYTALMRRLRQLGGDDALETRVEGWLRQVFDQHGRDCSYLGLPEDGSAVPDWLIQATTNGDRVELSDRINGALSHLLRIDRVKACAHVDINAYGDEGWLPVGPAYRGRAEHGDELTRLYNASSVNLDIPRIYQRDIITMRVFDVLLCAGVLLTEPSAELLELFQDGTHLFTYRDDASLRKRIEELSRDPVAAKSVAEQGRKLVEREHLLSHRLKTILAAIEQRGWL